MGSIIFIKILIAITQCHTGIVVNDRACKYFNGHGVIIETVIEELNAELDHWDDLIDSYVISVFFVGQDELIMPDGQLAGGSCTYDRLNHTFEIRIRVYEDGSISTYTVAHEFVHAYLMGLYNDFTHRKGWFYWPHNDESALDYIVSSRIDNK